MEAFEKAKRIGSQLRFFHRSRLHTLCRYGRLGPSGLISSQIKAMQTLLEEQLEQGSMGMSCGLEYAPGAYASDEELVQLLKSSSQTQQTICHTHAKPKTTVWNKPFQKLSLWAKKAGARLQISHLKAQNFDNWHKGPQLIRLIEDGPGAADWMWALIGILTLPFQPGLSSFIPLDGRQGSTDDVRP